MQVIKALKDYDEQRDGFAGEHWLALAAGLGIWAATRKHPSFLVRTLGLVGGTALVGRAASGRDGVGKLLKYLPVGAAIEDDARPTRRVKANT